MHLTTIGLATVIALTSAVAFAQREASDHIPSFHAERTCKAVKEDGDEAYKDCLSGEKAARQRLEPIWSSYSASRRAECISETFGIMANSPRLSCRYTQRGPPPNAMISGKSAPRSGRRDQARLRRPLSAPLARATPQATGGGPRPCRTTAPRPPLAIPSGR
jgi:hypothetical protein